MEFWKNVSHLEMGVIELSSHVKNAKALPTPEEPWGYLDCVI